jgi:hypothetical protein
VLHTSHCTLDTVVGVDVVDVLYNSEQQQAATKSARERHIILVLQLQQAAVVDVISATVHSNDKLVS